MTRDPRALLAPLLALVAFAAMAHACTRPASSAGATRIYLPYAEPPRSTPCDYRRDWWGCWMATVEARQSITPTPTRTLGPWMTSTPWPGWTPTPIGALARDIGWDLVAVQKAIPSRVPTGTPTATERPPRTRRPPRATGTPTQIGMLPPPTCGAGTVAPGTATPWPLCYPWGPAFTPTPIPSYTPTGTPTDAPTETATIEPTPTPLLVVLPADVRAVPIPTPTPARTLWLFPLFQRRGRGPR